MRTLADIEADEAALEAERRAIIAEAWRGPGPIKTAAARIGVSVDTLKSAARRYNFGGRGGRWSREHGKLEDIKIAFLSGDKRHAVAAEFGVDLGQLYKLARQHGWATGKPGRPRKQPPVVEVAP